jgi:hypothetical protein
VSNAVETGGFTVPDYNLTAAICRELDRANPSEEPGAIAERVASQIPDGCLRAVLMHEFLPRRVATEAAGQHARRVASGRL